MYSKDLKNVETPNLYDRSAYIHIYVCMYGMVWYGMVCMNVTYMTGVHIYTYMYVWYGMVCMYVCMLCMYVRMYHVCVCVYTYIYVYVCIVLTELDLS